MDLHLITSSYSFLFLSLLAVLSSLLFFLRPTIPKSSPLPLPPGPARWPIVGNLFSLGHKPHKSLAKLAAIHGPLFSLRLGHRTTVVISSADVVKEVMLHHDAAFAGRSIQQSACVLGHYEASVVFLSPCPRWRFLRRICASHVFSNSRLEVGRALRMEKVKQLISYTEKCSKLGKTINIGQVAFTTVLNIVSNIFFSMDMVDLSSDYGREFKELVWEMMVMLGTPNLADFFPVLRVVDPQGVKRHSTTLVRKMIKIFDDIIGKRVIERNKHKDFEDIDVLDCLLTITQNDENDFRRLDIPHLLMDLFAAGTDTTSTSIEWAMSALLHNPEKLKKVQDELDKVIGKGNPFEETHLGQLSYLHAFVKETLRFYPAAPFLVPRNAETDVELRGYSIPRNTQVLVNLWAMGRDEKIWKNPNEFEPERFLDMTLDYKGHDSEFIPFGFGRRMCPGLPLASRVLMLVVGSLIHSFDWRLPNDTILSDMDMDDKFGFTLQKAQPLHVVPVMHKQ